MSAITEVEKAETLRKIAVMQAYVDGEEIEVTGCDGAWIKLDRPVIWNWEDCQYRVRPEPREFWVNAYPSGILRAHLSREDADANRTRRIACIRVREVVE